MGSLLSLAAAAVAALPLGQHGSAPAAHALPHASLAASEIAMPVATSARRRPKAALRNLRACGNTYYNATAFRCTRDERPRPIVSTTAHCTVDVYAYSAVIVRGKMTYQGQTLFTRSSKVRARTILRLNLFIELPLTLPGGRYTCTISAAGRSVKANIAGGGSPGPVSSAAVCTSSRALNNLCASDDSALPLGPTTSLTCSGLFAAQKGHFGGIELLYNQAGVWTSLSRVEGALKGPIVPANLVVPGPLGQPFAPGQYACRFSVDGQTVVEKLFSVGA